MPSDKNKKQKNPPEEERCSFCGKPRSMVGELFEGSGGNVRICDQCIGVCNIMMGNKPERNTPPMPSYFSPDDFVDLNNLLMESPSEGTKTSPKKSQSPKFSNTVIKPRELSEYLDQYVIGQSRAKKVVSVAVYNPEERRCRTPEKQRPSSRAYGFGKDAYRSDVGKETQCSVCNC